METANGWNAVKVFSATKARERMALGEKVTAFVEDLVLNHDGGAIVRTDTLQSSDSEFHCLTIVLFYHV